MDPIRIAILDLYDGFANQGMRCIREIIASFAEEGKFSVQLDEFDVRQRLEIPDDSYHIYISSGGPGSPLESQGAEWETLYFNWLGSIEQWNAGMHGQTPRHVFFICHSFQLVCRHYQLGNVCKRKSTSFGVFPVHMLHGAEKDVVFNNLKDPFYAVDSRDYQVITPDHQRIKKMGGAILAIEKARPHVPLERAVMALRINEYFVGTQFHPEADALGMKMYLETADKKQTVIENHGFEKWRSMVEHLGDPDKILFTYNNLLPNFLRVAARHLQPVSAA